MSENNNCLNCLANNNIYLSKVLIFTQNALDLAEELKDNASSTMTTSCLNTIGMYPLIERINTPLGILCMSIWIISTQQRFEQFRLGYYSGASHSIILCNNQEELNNISNLYQITPLGVPTTILKRIPNDTDESIDEQGILLINDIIEEDQSRPIFYHNFQSITDLKNVFQEIGQKIAEDIASGEYHTFTPQIMQPKNVYKLYNKRSFDKVQELVEKLGYKLEENGVVNIAKGDFIFEIDFYRNHVTAMINYCVKCNKKCKHYRRLCVLEQAQGYSNQIQFDNLRALAILYSIHDGQFLNLSGEKRIEDIQYQLQKLKSVYEANCRFLCEENKFLQQIKKKNT
ncbi:MAG: hypothetical protein EAX90_07635 [Candidatus Heimdallarchaeota archaeon]|nr:hypothetical protein [Candidatus Heimdallarchaeota archaeon]